MGKINLPAKCNIAVLNRGESALRFIRAVKEYNFSGKGTELKTVAFYLPEEEEAPFVRQADMAFSFTRLSDSRNINRNVYLNREQLLEAMKMMECTAAWVGWGFLSEDASFIRFLEEHNIIFFGPPAEAVALLGDKIAAKNLADATDVPVTPWTRGAIKNQEEALAFADAIGYPCMIKAALAGGGRGIRRVNSRKELITKYESAREETIRITGSDILFIEQVVEKGRHLEVQALADRFGNVNTFGVRDCSVQRRNQKIIEETPPPNFDDSIIEKMETCSARLLKAAHYESAGTVEFLYDLNSNQFYFMEVNTRLQVEHPITEQAFGVDLVHGQIDVARGVELKEEKKTRRMAAVEVRLNAEDPDRGFTPAPGKVIHFQIPSGPGIRVDSGISQCTTISAEFDSMIAKIIAYAPTRELAFARLKRALNELEIKIEGGTTNRAFLNALLADENIRKGGIHTRYVEELLAGKPVIVDKEDWNIALIAASIEQYISIYQEKFINFQQQLTGSGYPRQLSVSGGHEIRLSANRKNYIFKVKAVGPNQYHIQSGETVLAVEYHRKKHGALLNAGNFCHHIQTVPRGSDIQIEVDGIPYLVELESSGAIKAPSPGIVLSVAVKPGQKAEKGQLLIVLEAMKMEMIVQSPEKGFVREIFIRVGEQVTAGQVLARLDMEKKETDTGAIRQGKEDKVRFDSLVNEENAWKIIEEEFRSVFLGYDHDSSVAMIVSMALAFKQEKQKEQKQKLISLFLTGLRAYVEIEKLFFSPPVKPEKLSRLASYSELLSHYFRRQVDREKGLPSEFITDLGKALNWYFPERESRSPEENIQAGDITDREDDEAVHHLYISHSDLKTKQELLKRILVELQKLSVQGDACAGLGNQLHDLVYISQFTRPDLSDIAVNTRFLLIDKKKIEIWKKKKRHNMGKMLDRLLNYHRGDRIYDKLINFVLENKYQLFYDLAERVKEGDKAKRSLILEILCRNMCNDRRMLKGDIITIDNFELFSCTSEKNERIFETSLIIIVPEQLGEFTEQWNGYAAGNQGQAGAEQELIILINLADDSQNKLILDRITASPLACTLASLGLLYADGKSDYRHFHTDNAGVWREDMEKQGFNPRAFREFRICRLSGFAQEIRYAGEFVHLMHLTAKENSKDERLFAMVEVPSFTVEFNAEGRIEHVTGLENVFDEAVYVMRAEQARSERRLHWNRIIILIDTNFNIRLEENTGYTSGIIEQALDLGLEKIIIYTHRQKPGSDTTEEQTEDVEISFDRTTGKGYTLNIRKPDESVLESAGAYAARVVQARQQNSLYPYEIIKMLIHPELQVPAIFPRGRFDEYDITCDPVTGVWNTCAADRPFGENTCNIVFGIIESFPESREYGFKRVLLVSDSTKDMGALSEPECRRVIAALDLAEKLDIPLEWLPASSGARIDMQSGTENLDWTARVLRRIIEFTQRGGEINILVLDINIGAQSYWNAEATMLIHTRGVLIMSGLASMLLTGKKALDFSGSVSAENHIAIGGAEMIMCPNGEAQVAVKNIHEAYTALFHHYSIVYRKPGERFPPHVKTIDPAERNICETPYSDPLKQGFSTIGDIFSPTLNPERKKPFDIRQVMKAVVDEDCPVFERWAGMKDAEIAIVWETRIGGYSAGMIGIESQSLSRIGEIPHDGPEAWTGGTLFPLSSKKIAHAINAFSDALPLVIMANLSGFDGSPESLRKLQLEYGAEIGRAIVNFRGSVFFIVTARYHGGAYVVFSKTLNPHLKVAAIEGSYASVIGGAPAAAVVFPRLVKKRTFEDQRVIEADQKRKAAGLSSEQKNFDEIYQKVYMEKQAELAKEFDNIHSVARAKEVGSIDDIISAGSLRPYLVRELGKVYAKASAEVAGDGAMDFPYG